MNHPDTTSEFFERDKNDTKKIWCNVCMESYIPDLTSQKRHLGKQKHLNNITKKKENIQAYLSFPDFTPLSRASMIWSHLTVMRNLSYNLSDFIGKYFPHMFKDSQAATKIQLYRQKVQKIVNMVLVPYIENICQKYMKNICSLMIDGSRDISNKNELMIAAPFFNEDKNEVKRVVFQIIEQNDTKAKKIYESLKEVLSEQGIPFRSILSVMTDNARDMCAEQGLTGLLKSQNNSIYTFTCICHCLNLILKHLLKFLKSDDFDIESNQISIEDFVNTLTSVFHYSYKKEEQYTKFKENFLKNKKRNGNLYQNHEKFIKISSYSEVRFLSLGNALNSILPQWKCLEEFFKEQIENRKVNELSKKQVQIYEEISSMMLQNDFKYFFLIMKMIVDELNTLNKVFQKHKTQIHLIFPLSWKLLHKYINILYLPIEEEKLQNPTKLKKTLQDHKNFVKNNIFLQSLQNYIDFNQEFIEFGVNLDNLSFEIIDLSKKTFSNLCVLILEYLPIHNKTTEAFQLLDPRKRKRIINGLTLFRDYLLKRFVFCYGFQNYDLLLEEFQEFSEIEDIELPVNLEKYVSSKTGHFKVEDFWLNRNVQENWKFKLISKFFSRLLLIPHSNMFIESMFSHVGAIKTPLRNLLEVNSVSNIMKIKSYYLKSKDLEKDEKNDSILFEPTEDHYSLYKSFIKDE